MKLHTVIGITVVVLGAGLSVSAGELSTQSNAVPETAATMPEGVLADLDQIQPGSPPFHELLAFAERHAAEQVDSIAAPGCQSGLWDLFPCTIDFKNGLASSTCNTPTTFGPYMRTVGGGLMDAEGDTWFETVLEVDLGAGPLCSEVCVTLEYEGPAVGWTFDGGDSCTANGFGGNSGGGEGAAELEILGEVQTTYGDGRALGLAFPCSSGVTNLSRAVPLTNGGYKICMKNQFAGFGNSAGAYDATNQLNCKDLFYLDNTGGPGAPAGLPLACDGGTPTPPVTSGSRNDLWLGFNRVVNLGGAGPFATIACSPISASSCRKGQGLRRATVVMR